MSDEKKPQYALRVHGGECPISYNNSYHTYEIQVDIMQIDGREIKGTSSYPDNPAHFYPGLVMGNTTFAGSEPTPSDSLYYDRQYRVKQHDAERMYKTLSRIAKAQDRIRETEGWPQTFGQVVNRFARIVGAKTILVENNEQHRDVTGERYTWSSPGRAVSQIDDLTAAWVRALKKKQEQEQQAKGMAAAGEEIAS